MGIWSGIKTLIVFTRSSLFKLVLLPTILARNIYTQSLFRRRLTEDQIFATALAAQTLGEENTNTDSINTNSTSSKSSDPSQWTPKTAKIKKLEEELNKLRGEINLLPDTDNGVVISNVIASQPPVIPEAPPLPPPLPSESFSKPIVFRKKSTDSKSEDQENQSENNNNSFVTPKKRKYEPRQKSRIDIALSDIVNKGSALKRTERERSPGGTPIKTKVKNSAEKAIVTTNDFVASALKKRFKNVRQSPDPSPKSPGSDWEDNEYSYLNQSAPPGTPYVPLKSAVRSN